jgi:hypothetical protein
MQILLPNKKNTSISCSLVLFTGSRLKRDFLAYVRTCVTGDDDLMTCVTGNDARRNASRRWTISGWQNTRWTGGDECRFARRISCWWSRVGRHIPLPPGTTNIHCRSGTLPEITRWTHQWTSRSGSTESPQPHNKLNTINSQKVNGVSYRTMGPHHAAAANGHDGCRFRLRLLPGTICSPLGR